MMNLSNYLLYSLTGMTVVFFALFLLMIMIKLMTQIIPAERKIKENTNNKKHIKSNTYISEYVNIYDTDPRDAAMIMAIVADNLNIPVNQLKFISIKEVKQ